MSLATKIGNRITIFNLVLLLLSISATSHAQSDTTQAAKNVHTAVLAWEQNGNIECDTSVIANNKAAGNGIPHLTIYNLSQQAVSIKLSFDAKTWTRFYLKPMSKNLYRTRRSRMFIIINPDSNLKVKAKLTMYKKYKIFYYNELGMFEIKEIP